MRTREFRRVKRYQKIQRRRKMAVQIGKHGAPMHFNRGPHFEKLDAAVNGEKPGILAKHDYGMITYGVPKKTKTKNRQATYRHKGGYGKANDYTRHDQRQFDRMMA